MGVAESNRLHAMSTFPLVLAPSSSSHLPFLFPSSQTPFDPLTMMQATEKNITVSQTPAQDGNVSRHSPRTGNLADQQGMERMNKKQETRRDFKNVTMLAFSMILMCSWEGVLSTSAIAFSNGGRAGALYTNLAVWLGFIAVYASLGELGSMMPTSGDK